MSTRLRVRCGWTLLIAAAAAAPGAARAQEADPGSPHYEIVFEARILPTQRAARASWTVGVGASSLREVTLRIDPERHYDFSADGGLRIEGARVVWSPPPSGGSLHYGFRIDSIRPDGGYDARCSESWALFRGDDLFPPARTRTLRDAHSVSILKLHLPRRWSSAVPYSRSGPHTYEVDDPSRRFDRPTGWILVGRLGVLRERVAGSHLSIAGPTGQGVRRHDMLAFLRWNLPELRRVVGSMPERLLVVSAGDPFWRGGLSGPNSTFLHADRPLISGDATSPLLHEIFHSVSGSTAGPDGDWIIEGLAELYSLEIMVRSHTLSRRRHARALEALERRAAGAELSGARSSGAQTARAVIVLRALDHHIRAQTEEDRSLDDVVALMAAEPRTLTTAGFRALAEEATGLDLGGFFERTVGRIAAD